MRLPVTFYNSKQYGTLIGEPFPIGRQPFATGREYSEVIPKIKEHYLILVKKAKEEGLRKALDDFLKQISNLAILDASFKKCLAIELGISEDGVEEAFLHTKYVAERLKMLKINYRRIKKTDPVEYAESIGELVSLFGTSKAMDILKQHNFKISYSLLNYLYKVSMMPISVKRLIRERKISLTIAFELPIDQADEIAEKIVGLKFDEARGLIKRLKL